MTPSITLYGCWRSSCSHRLQIALRLKQLPFAYRPVSLDALEQREPWFLALNPLGQVPVLEVDGERWADSLVALETLEERFTGWGVPLLPAEATARLQVRRALSAIGSSLQPLLLPGQFRRHLALDDATLNDLRRQHQTEALTVVQELIRSSAGSYGVGDQVSWADVALVAHLDGVARLGLDLERFALLRRLYNQCMELEAFDQANPSRMVDAPGHAPAPADTGAALNAVVAYKEPAGALQDYLCRRANAPIPGHAMARQLTAEHCGATASKVSALEVCLLLRWLAASRGCRRALEIGVFSGSSSLALLDGLGPGGQLTAIDSDPSSTAIAQQCWHQLGYSERVQFLLGDALQLLPQLEPGFELIYIDGANWEYSAYLELALPLLAPGGVLVFDNVLWRGQVCAPRDDDRSALALARFNAELQGRDDLISCILSLGDGIALASRRTPQADR